MLGSPCFAGCISFPVHVISVFAIFVIFENIKKMLNRLIVFFLNILIKR